jgi:hypothetical protein
MRPAVLAALLLAGSATGCVSGSNFAIDIGRLPTCTSRAGTVSRGVLIMAQSVPTAQWLPCIRSLPPGWSFDQVMPRDGQVTMTFNSDRDGRHALTVLLERTCDVAGATPVPSELPDLRRFERVTRVSSGYGGERLYSFTGGCVTYRFDLRGGTRAEPVAAVSESLGFLSRKNLDDKVREVSGGRLHLDAAAGRPR